MSAAAPARFTFDLDLGRREERNRVVTESAMSTLLEDARSAGYAEGFAAGEQGSVARSAQQLAAAAAALGDRVAALAAAHDDMSRASIANAAELAATIARKLAASLIDSRPTGEIEALIHECLASLEGAPHLVIRCHEELADAVREIAMTHIQTSGFSGRLVVMGDPEIAPGDCRLEWVDGGIVRDRAAIDAEIDRHIAAFAAALTNTGGAARAQESE